MADHLTEEEQIQALKEWWKTYWKSIVIPVVAVAGGYYGWNVWEDQKAATAAQASDQYASLISAMETAPGAELSEEKRSESSVLATQITQDYAGSLYADQANLILARLAVDEKDLPKAEGYLQRVVDAGANNAIKDLAKARLARVKLALGSLDAALALVAVSGDSKYASLFAEIRGDVLAAQGKTDAAKTAFQESMDSLSPQEFQRRSILQIKLDGADILALSPEAPSATEPSAEDAGVEEDEATDAETSEVKDTPAGDVAENS
ncbi:MAG: tetratricopeptide repeat protein [Agarilytica sp.]